MGGDHKSGSFDHGLFIQCDLPKVVNLNENFASDDMSSVDPNVCFSGKLAERRKR